MAIGLTETERSRLRGMARRPRSRKQLYRAEALLDLDEGQPIEVVARRMHVGIERIEAWVDAFQEKRMKSLEEPDAGRPRAHSEGRFEGNDFDAETG